MKRILSVIVASLATATTLLGATNKPKLTPEQIEDRKYRHFGGYVTQQRETKVISIASEQTIVGEGVLSGIAAEMQTMLTIPVMVNAKKDVAFTLKVREGDADIPLVVDEGFGRGLYLNGPQKTAARSVCLGSAALGRDGVRRAEQYRDLAHSLHSRHAQCQGL